MIHYEHFEWNLLILQLQSKVVEGGEDGWGAVVISQGEGKIESEATIQARLVDERKPDPPIAPPADEAPTTQAGDIETRTVSGADGKGSTTYITGARIGTVRQTEGAGQIQRWDTPAITMAGMADLLDRVAPISVPIVDQTHLPGRYAVSFEATLREVIGLGNPGDMEAVVVAAFNDGLRKLGLKLERRKATRDGDGGPY